MNPTPQDVLAMFQTLTNVKFRRITPDQEDQAIEFLKWYTLDDLALVIRYLKREIAANRGGYNAQSLTWSCLFGRRGAGDEFGKFGDRLGLAEIAFRPPRKVVVDVPTATPVDASNTIVRFAPPPEPAPVELGVAVSEQLSALRKAIGGGA